MVRLPVQEFGRVTAVEGSGELLAQIPDFPKLEKVHGPKKDLILVCVDRMPKGAVIIFDELNCPGRTIPAVGKRRSAAHWAQQRSLTAAGGRCRTYSLGFRAGSGTLPPLASVRLAAASSTAASESETAAASPLPPLFA